MLFYAYDLEHYRDQLRGFYFDYQAEIPGPLATNEDQLMADLAVFQRDGGFQDHHTELLGFNQKYCSWENGTASAQVVQVIEKGL